MNLRRLLIFTATLVIFTAFLLILLDSMVKRMPAPVSPAQRQQQPPNKTPNRFRN